MVKAREELQIEKSKWSKEREELIRLQEPSESTNYTSYNNQSNRER